MTQAFPRTCNSKGNKTLSSFAIFSLLKEKGKRSEEREVTWLEGRLQPQVLGLVPWAPFVPQVLTP
jgi:hypothetical protein